MSDNDLIISVKLEDDGAEAELHTAAQDLDQIATAATKASTEVSTYDESLKTATADQEKLKAVAAAAWSDIAVQTKAAGSSAVAGLAPIDAAATEASAGLKKVAKGGKKAATGIKKASGASGSLKKVATESETAAAGLKKVGSAATGVKKVATGADHAADSVKKLAETHERNTSIVINFWASITSSVEKVVSGGGIEKVTESFSTLGSTIEGLASGAVASLTGGLERLGGLAIGATRSLVEGGIASNAEFETLGNKFQILLGSYSEATARAQELQKLGLTSPAQLNDIANMDTKLTNFGLDVQDTAAKVGISGKDIRQTVVDTAAAIANGAEDMGGKMNRIAIDLGKFYESGTAASITDLIKLGATTKEQLEKAGMAFDAHGHAVGDHARNEEILLKSLGEKYHGMSLTAMSSLAGIQSNWQDMTQYIERTLTGSMFDALKNSYIRLNQELTSDSAMESFGRINTAIGKLIDIGGQLFEYFDAKHDLIPSILGDIAAGFEWVASTAGKVVTVWRAIESNFFAPIQAIVGAASGWGEGIVTNFVNGIISGFGPLAGTLQQMGEVIRYWLQPNSPPRIVPDLDKIGTGTMDVYLQAFTKADYGVFNQIGAQVSEAINGLVNSNMIPKVGAIPMIIGTREAIAAALQEFDTTGAIAESTMARIKAAAGPAGQSIVELTTAAIDAAKATRELAAAQDVLSGINSKFKEDMAPLLDKERELKGTTDALNNAYKDSIAPLNDRAAAAKAATEAFRAQADIDLGKQKDDLDSLKQKQQALAEAATIAIGEQKSALDSLKQKQQDLADAAVAAINQQKSALDSLKAQQSQITEQNAADLDRIRQKQTESAEAGAAALDRLKAKQQELTDAGNAALEPLKERLNLITEDDREIANKEKILDLTERITGTGHHAHDLESAKLNLQADQLQAKAEEFSFANRSTALQTEINSGLYTGTVLEQKKNELALLTVEHQKKLIEEQKKLEADQVAISDHSKNSHALVLAQHEKEKLLLADKIKDQEELNRHNQAGIKDSIREQEAHNKIVADSFKDQIASQTEINKARSEAIKDQIVQQEGVVKATEKAAKDQQDQVKDVIKAQEGVIKAAELAAKAKDEQVKDEIKAQEDVIKAAEKADKEKEKAFHGAEEDIKEIIRLEENKHKAALDQIHREEEANKEKENALKTAHDDAVARQQDLIDLAKSHKKVADEHLATLQDHNKVLGENAKLLEQQDKLLDGIAKKAAAAAKAKMHHPRIKAGGGIGGLGAGFGGVKPKDDGTDKDTKDHGDTKEYLKHLDAEAEKVRAINEAVKSAKDGMTTFARSVIEAFDKGGVLGVVDLAFDKLMSLADNLGGVVQKAVGPITSMVAGYGLALWGWISDAIPVVVGYLESWASTVLGWIKAAYPIVLGTLSGWASTLWGWISDATPIVVSQLESWGASVWGWLKSAFPVVVTSLSGWASALWDWISPAIAGAGAKLEEWGVSIWEWVKVKAGDLGKALLGWATELGAWLVPAVTKFLQDWPAQFGNILNSMHDTIAPLLGTVADWLGEHLPDILKALGGVALAIGVFIGETVGVLARKLWDWGNEFVNWIGPRIPGILDELGKMAGFIGNWISGTALPWLGDQIGILAPKLWEWIKDVTPVVLKTLGSVFDGIANALDPQGALVRGIVDMLGLAKDVFWRWIVDVTPVVLAKLGDWKDQLVAWFTGTALPWLGDHFAKWGAAAWQWIEDVTPVVLAKLGAWKDSFVAWFTGTALPWLGDHFKQWGIAAWQWIEDVTPTVLNKFGAWKDAITGWLGDRKTDFINKLGEWKDEALNWVSAAADGIGVKLDNFRNTITDWIDKKKDTFATAALSLGSSLISGIIDGITNNFYKLSNAMGNMATNAIDAGKKALGINSPSMVAAQEMGDPLAEGWGLGITRSAPLALAAVNDLAQNLVKAGSGAIPVASGVLIGPITQNTGSLGTPGLGASGQQPTNPFAGYGTSGQQPQQQPIIQNTGPTINLNNCVFPGSTPKDIKQVFEGLALAGTFGKV